MTTRNPRGERRGRDAIAVLLAALPLPLAGCIKIGAEPPKQLISLSPEFVAPAGDLGGGKLATALIVVDPETERELDVLRVPVQVTPASIAYLKKASWLEKPARQFRRLLAETIRARGHVLVIEGSGFESGAGDVLSGRLLKMGYDAASGAVVVRYDALLTRPDGTARDHRFEASVPSVPATARDVAPALNRAANDVALQVSDWVARGGA